MREAVASIPDVAWEDIGGLTEVKDRLSELVEKPLLHPTVFANMQIDPPSGILLYGPPGGGKTMLAQAIASQCQANFISVKGPEIYSKWLGESEEGVRHIFRVARQVAPSVIFFDQIDAIAPLRGTSDSGTRAAERVVNQMLTEIDGIEPMSGIVVIGATNRFDLLDPAILRPGRFGVHVFVPLPDEESRRAILLVQLKRAYLDADLSPETVADYIGPRTDGFSGAELGVICQEAKLTAARATGYTETVPLTLRHFHEALERTFETRQVYTMEPALS